MTNGTAHPPSHEQRRSPSGRLPLSNQPRPATAPSHRTSSSAQHRPPHQGNNTGADPSGPKQYNGNRGTGSSRISTGSVSAGAPEPQNVPRKPDHSILFQTFFKSVGSRTYAAQIKQATNGNQYMVVTEGRRDKNSDDVRKMRINIFSEDFEAFFDLLRQTARYIKEHPLSAEFQAERKKFWQNLGRKKAGMNRGDAPRPLSASARP
ncbi:MAG: DUF3276 family protein [Burkholderiales bacterium]|nr:DUF3276 family protein [Phycisphaerae bacterium]